MIKALEEVKVRPEEAMMIGDLPVDLVAGRNAGCITGAAMWGYGVPKELLRLDPNYVLWHILAPLFVPFLI